MENVVIELCGLFSVFQYISGVLQFSEHKSIGASEKSLINLANPDKPMSYLRYEPYG